VVSVRGAIEVAAAFLLLIPRTSRIAVAALACTMLGAILTHIFVVGITPAILLPIILLAVLMLIMWADYARTRR
jgi:putative oxidoreductase